MTMVDVGQFFELLRSFDELSGPSERAWIPVTTSAIS